MWPLDNFLQPFQPLSLKVSSCRFFTSSHVHVLHCWGLLAVYSWSSCDSAQEEQLLKEPIMADPDQLWLAEFKKRATLFWRKLCLLFVCKHCDSCGKIRKVSKKILNILKSWRVEEDLEAVKSWKSSKDCKTLLNQYCEWIRLPAFRPDIQSTTQIRSQWVRVIDGASYVHMYVFVVVKLELTCSVSK